MPVMPALAQAIRCAGRLFEALPSPYGLLHARLEILHAQACARDADVRQRGNVLKGQRARINFDRHFGRGCDRKIEPAALR